jgi:hypothetical protein
MYVCMYVCIYVCVYRARRGTSCRKCSMRRVEFAPVLLLSSYSTKTSIKGEGVLGVKTRLLDQVQKPVFHRSTINLALREISMLDQQVLVDESGYSTVRPLQQPPESTGTSHIHQHRFDFTPLLNHESVFDPLVKVIKLCSTDGKILDCRMKHTQEGQSHSIGDVNVNVRGRWSTPLKEKFGRTRSHRDSRHDWCLSINIRDIWIAPFSKRS